MLAEAVQAGKSNPYQEYVSLLVRTDVCLSMMEEVQCNQAAATRLAGHHRTQHRSGLQAGEALGSDSSWVSFGEGVHVAEPHTATLFTDTSSEPWSWLTPTGPSFST